MKQKWIAGEANRKVIRYVDDNGQPCGLVGIAESPAYACTIIEAHNEIVNALLEDQQRLNWLDKCNSVSWEVSGEPIRISTPGVHPIPDRPPQNPRRRSQAGLMKSHNAGVVKWQTRTFEGRMPKGVEVRLLSPAR